MKAPRTFVLAGLSILLVVLVYFFIRGFALERIAGPAEAPVPAADGGAPETPVSKEMMKATLFFQRDDDGMLVAETRDVPSTGSVAADAEAVLTELIKGPTGGLVATVPPETKLRQVFLTKDGTAYADFTKDLSAAHPSGSDAETATVYAIVDTLAVNFKAIKKVFILVDGEERETLNGHVTLDRAFHPDYTRIARS
jgi:spore germination protein GerM